MIFNLNVNMMKEVTKNRNQDFLKKYRIFPIINFIKVKILNLKFLLVILTSFIYTYANSQSISNLDKSHGFKDFKIGDSYQKWAGQINKLFEGRESEVMYEYKGTCCTIAYNQPVKSIVLMFRNDKLTSINIVIQSPGTEINEPLDQFTQLNNILQSLYGKPTAFNSDANSGKAYYGWTTDKIYLMSDFKYLGLEKGSRISLAIGDVKYFNN